MSDSHILKEFQQIPGIGKSLARDLYDLGIRGIQDLKGRDPQELYDALCEKTGTHQDRCVLYTFAAQSILLPKLLMIRSF